MDRIHKSFQYSSQSDLNNLPLQSKYNTYSGGGYVFELRGKLSYLKANLSLLQQHKWIDKQTRAVLFEFSIFNPNINLIQVCTILVEFLPTGSLLKYHEFNQIDLFNVSVSNNASFMPIFKLVLIFIYLAYIVYFIINEAQRLFKLKLAYFLSFWSIINLLIISLSIAGFVFYGIRYVYTQELLEFFSKTSGYSYKNLNRLSYVNLAYLYCFALSSSLSTLYLLNLFKFSKSISSLALVFSDSYKTLISFLFIFVLIYSSFGQIFYLLFSHVSYEYSTIVRAFETNFQIILGKFPLQSITQNSPVLGSILLVFYNTMTVIIMTNILITILTDSFSKVKQLNGDDSEMFFGFIKRKLNEIIPYGRAKVEHDSRLAYNDHVLTLEHKVNDLVEVLNKVCFFNYKLINLNFGFNSFFFFS